MIAARSRRGWLGVTLAFAVGACGRRAADPSPPADLAAVSPSPPAAESVLADVDHGWTAYYDRRYPDAIAAFEKALERDPEAVAALVGLGWSQLGSGNLVAARPLFERALAAAPDDGPALAGYGRLLQTEGDLAGAIAAWTRMAAVIPGPHEGVLSLARVYLDRGDCPAARPYLERLLGGLPPDWAIEGLERCREEPPAVETFHGSAQLAHRGLGGAGGALGVAGKRATA